MMDGVTLQQHQFKPSIAMMLIKLVGAALLLSTVSAFAPNALQPIKVRTASLPRSLPVLESAKILPIAYTSASAALIFKATKAATNADAAVLAATALLACFNLAPTDNARLASAKRADKKYPPAVAGEAKQLRQAAKTWRSVVRIKLIGQVVGLVTMASAKTSTACLRGASMVMGANMLFFLCGAGRAMHDQEGTSAPMPSGRATMILTIDTILTMAALIASRSPLESTRRTVLASIYAGGVFIGALEGVATLFSR